MTKTMLRPLCRFYSCRAWLRFNAATASVSQIAFPNAPNIISSRNTTPDQVFRVRSFSTTSAACKEKVSKRHTGKQPPKIEYGEEELQKVFDAKKYGKELDDLVVAFRDELVKHFSLRTRIASFDTIPVEISGKKYKISDVAQITFKTPQLVMMNMSSMPEHAKLVVEALNKSGMNLNPQMEGHNIFIPLPKVSRDHREQLVKNSKQVLEEFKKKARGVQNDRVRIVKIKEHTSSDVIFNVVAIIQREADVCMAKMTDLFNSKEQELLEQLQHNR